MSRIKILFCNSFVFASMHDGIGRVTKILTDYFESKNIDCIYCAFHGGIDNLADRHHYFFPNAANPLSDENIDYLTSIIKREEITHIINQQGCSGDPFNLSSLIVKLKKNYPSVKLISVLHGPLFDTYYHASAVYYPKFSKYKVGFLSQIFDVKLINQILVKYMQYKQKSYFVNLYEESDAVITLSESYLKEYINLIKCDGRKLLALSNPNTISPSSEVKKEKVVLWVGRITFTHKRPDLMISIWEKLGKANNDWTLHILGEGKDFEELQFIINQRNLTNVQIHGQVDPTDFYKKAAIFCMTSTYEGFPLVLTEAMSNSVVPMAFNTFGALSDIIDDKENGVIIPPFDVDVYTKELKTLMMNSDLCETMAKQAYSKAQQFTLDHIGRKWINLIEKV